MGARIALLLTVLIHAEVACGHATLIHEWTGRGFCPHRAKFTPDGRYVLMVGSWTGDAAGNQPEFRAWDVDTRQFVGEHRLEGRGVIDGLDIAPDGETLLVGTTSPGGTARYGDRNRPVSSNQAWLWNWRATPVRPRSTRVRSSLTPMRRLAALREHLRIGQRTLLSPDADLIAVRRLETRPLPDSSGIWSYSEIDILEPSGQRQSTIVPPDQLKGGTRGMAFSPDGSRLVTLTLFDTAPHDRGYLVGTELRLWDVESGEEIARNSVTDSQVRRLGEIRGGGLAFSADGSTIASHGPDDAVQLWDAGTLEPMRTLAGLDDAVSSLAFSPDGTLVAATNWWGTVQSDRGQFLVWDATTGEVRWRIDAGEPDIREVEFSPDGGWLLTRGNSSARGGGSAMRLWDVNELLAIGAEADEL